MPRKPVTVTLPSELIDAIDARATEGRKNRSQMIEELVQSAIAPSDESAFHESIQLRGETSTITALLRGMLDKDGPHKFESDRYWIVKFLVEPKPGEKPFGFFRVIDERPKRAK